MARRALCVGIDTYRLPDRLEEMAGTDVALRGSVNDALAWADVFGREYGFDRILVLLDGEATKSAVVGALEQLLGDSRDGDVLAFAFSGHGTYVVDRTGEGDERYDEAMVTHDDLLTDDEFAGLLDGLDSGARLTVISDSCFAAGVLDIEEEDTKPRGGDRAKGFRPKGFRPKGFRPKGFRPKHLPPDVFERETLAPRPPDRPYPRRRIEEHGMREMLLAAAGPGRIAFDDDFDGAPQGVLTHYALRAMNEARYDLTYAQLLERISTLIPPAFDQVPVLEGVGKEHTVFT